MRWRRRRSRLRGGCSGLRRSLLNPHPDAWPRSPSSIRTCRNATNSSGWICDEAKIVLDRPRVQLDLLREAEGKYTESTGEKLAHWQRRMIARYTRNLAHISGDLVASVYDLAVAARSVVDDNYGWEVWQMANRYLAQQEVSRSRNRAAERQRDLAQHQAAAHPPPASPPQAAPEAGGLEAAQERKGSRRMGAADHRRGDLLLSAGRSGDRRIRPVSQEKGQGDAFRRARARGAVHHFDSGRHRHSRDHPQLASAQDFCAQSAIGWRAKSARWW